MGYTTYFNGEIDLDKVLTEEHKQILEEFADSDHRDDKGMPGIWCQWIPTNDGSALRHDGGEKFYYYVAWMEYLIETFLKPWGYIANGEIEWDGEDRGDDGVLEVRYNIVSSYNKHTRAAELEAGLDKVLSLLPDQLPLLMGINGTIDAKIKALLSTPKRL